MATPQAELPSVPWQWIGLVIAAITGLTLRVAVRYQVLLLDYREKGNET